MTTYLIFHAAPWQHPNTLQLPHKTHMQVSEADYRNLLITNFILTSILFLIISACLIYLIFSKIKSIRRELKEERCGKVFPIGEKVDLETAQFPPVQPVILSRQEEATFTPAKSSSPSSLLAKSFTSTDFASKTLLDKKCFALAYNQKCPSGGLKDLIP